MSFTVGKKVIIQNLKMKPEYNNKEAIITSLLDNDNRYEVFVPDFGHKLRVKAINLFDHKNDIKKECIGNCLNVISNFIIQHEPYNQVEYNVRSRVEKELVILLTRQNMMSNFASFFAELLEEPWSVLVKDKLQQMNYCRIPKYSYNLLY